MLSPDTKSIARSFPDVPSVSRRAVLAISAIGLATTKFQPARPNFIGADDLSPPGYGEGNLFRARRFGPDGDEGDNKNSRH